jgi:hypothetical protein
MKVGNFPSKASITIQQTGFHHYFRVYFSLKPH